MSGFLNRLAKLLGAPEPAVPPRDPAGTPHGPVPAGISAEDDRLPDASRPRVARLLALIADIEARSQRDPLLVSAKTEVEQMRDSHLPQLITSYADIPPAHRAEIFRATGKSASYNLNEGLDRMIARLEAVAKSIAQGDIDSFADNLRFIERRYGEQDPLA